MWPKYPEEYSLSEIKLRLLMLEIKKCYGNIESKEWQDIFRGLLNENNQITEQEHEYLLSLSRLIECSNATSLCKLSSFIKSGHLYENGFKVVKEILFALSEHPNVRDRDSKGYCSLKNEVLQNFILDNRLEEIDSIIQIHKFFGFSVIVQELKSKPDEFVDVLEAVLVSFYIELRRLENNLLSMLKTQLIEGNITCQGVYNRDYTLKYSAISKKQWEILDFRFPNSASDGHAHNFSRLVFKTVKPVKKEKEMSNAAYITAWITADWKRGKFLDLNKVDLDSIATEYQKRLLIKKNRQYHDNAPVRRIIARKFYEFAPDIYKKPKPGRH